MSYFTHVRVNYMGGMGVEDDAVLPVAEAHFEECNYHAADVLSDFTKALGGGLVMFDDLTCDDFDGLLKALSRTFPAVTFWASGIGEEIGDVWYRRYLGGTRTAQGGPFFEG